jgi:hypothetical protein
VETPSSFLITIPQPKALRVLEMFDRNFELMSEYLTFAKNNKLVILNPVSLEILIKILDESC